MIELVESDDRAPERAIEDAENSESEGRRRTLRPESSFVLTRMLDNLRKSTVSRDRPPKLRRCRRVLDALRLRGSVSTGGDERGSERAGDCCF